MTSISTEALAETRAAIAAIADVSEQAREALAKDQRRARVQGRRAPAESLEQRYLRAKSELLRVTADYAQAHGIDVSAARKELEAIVAEADQHT